MTAALPTAILATLSKNGRLPLAALAAHHHVAPARVEAALDEITAAGIRLQRGEGSVELDEAAQPEVLVPEPAPVIGLDICAACGGEGRVLQPCWDYSSQTGYVPGERDCGPCPACDGTGREIVEGETADEPGPVFFDRRSMGRSGLSAVAGSA